MLSACASSTTWPTPLERWERRWWTRMAAPPPSIASTGCWAEGERRDSGDAHRVEVRNEPVSRIVDDCMKASDSSASVTTDTVAAPAIPTPAGRSRRPSRSRSRGRGGRDRHQRRLLTRPPRRPPGGLARAAARGSGRPDVAHRGRHRRHRQAVAHVAVATPVHVSLVAWSNWYR